MRTALSTENLSSVHGNELKEYKLLMFKIMFYLRLNKVRIFNNYTLLGTSNVQLMSFVTKGDADFPMLSDFFHTSDELQKKQMVMAAATKVISSRLMPEIQRVKDNQIIYFGDTGYNVMVSETIPDNLNWMLLVAKSNRKTVETATLLQGVLTEKNLSTFVGALAVLASDLNPVSAAISTLTTLVAQSVLKIMQNTHDRELGLLLTSFNRAEHYPNGLRNREDVPDATGNMRIDYTIFGY
jgi:hypothetical protein